MPPRLDLSASTHNKATLSPSRINLRRTHSYNAHDHGPLSVASPKLSFQHLLFSPPPSPSLPALIPRAKKTRERILRARPRRLARYATGFVILLTFFYLVLSILRPRQAQVAYWPYFAADEFEMVGQDELPDFPTPIVVTDHNGKSRWTVAIPLDQGFPLSMEQYSDISSQCHEASAQARGARGDLSLLNLHGAYDIVDDSYVDVEEAEATGLLARPARKRSFHVVPFSGHFVGLDPKMASKPVCRNTMTFVLETPDAGLGNTLMMLWTFYGLAKEQGRAFFIDDTRWAYGRFEDIFRLPPVPNCRPPQRHQIVPCPYNARHLVVTSITAKEIFPALLAKHRQTAGSGDSVLDLFALARTGYESLFALHEDDNNYVASRVEELNKTRNAVRFGGIGQPIIGLHVRHGDHHPFEYQYQGTYIPTEVFQSAAQDASNLHYEGTTQDERDYVTLLATDDPLVYLQPEFEDAYPAQDRLKLPAKASEDDVFGNPDALHDFEDQTLGWEGGFFATVFWNIGTERQDNAGAQVDQEPTPPTQAVKTRGRLARAYLLELSIIAETSDVTICAVSTMGCRILGVMIGWEKGIKGGSWINVDGDYSWTGIKW